MCAVFAVGSSVPISTFHLPGGVLGHVVAMGPHSVCHVEGVELYVQPPTSIESD